MSKYSRSICLPYFFKESYYYDEKKDTLKEKHPELIQVRDEVEGVVTRSMITKEELNLNLPISKIVQEK